MNKEYGLVSENNGSTVVAEYAGLKRKDTSYQSEAQLEEEFIQTLKDEGFEEMDINDAINKFIRNKAQSVTELD